MKRKDLIEKAEKLNAACEKLEGKELEAKTTEFDGVIAAIKQRDELAKLKPKKDKDKGKSDDDKTPLITASGEEKELERHFMDALKGKDIPDRARDQFQVTNPGFEKGAGGLRVPGSMRKHFLLPRVLAQLDEGKDEGKVDTLIPILSTDDPGPANLFQLPIGPVLHAEAEPPRLMEYVSSIPAPLGGVKIPYIRQTDANEYGAVAVTWGSEAGEKEETELKIDQLTITTHEVRAYTEVSDTALRRAPTFEPWLTRMLREAAADAVEDTIATGDGVTQPEGIASANMREILRDGAGINYTDLVALKYALRWNHRTKAAYVVADDGLRSLEVQMGAVDNRPIYNSSVAEGMYTRLLGRPYFGSHRMPAVGVEGDIVFMTKDAYMLAIETDVVIKRSEHYKFRDNVTAFAVFMLVGGRIVLPRLAVRLEDAGASSTSA